jgi:hypothetical protein
LPGRLSRFCSRNFIGFQPLSDQNRQPMEAFMKQTNWTSLVAAAVLAAGLAAAQAESVPAQADKGFNPDTGQINPGHPPIPSSGHTRAIPSQEDARAALMMPETGAISTGAAADSAPAATSTTGAATAEQLPGPIGSRLQTVPAKFSPRNDTLDRVPTMAWPLKLDAAQRQRIFDTVMAEDTKTVEATGNLTPAHALSIEQALNAVHPLPPSLGNIPILKGLSYVKTADKVFLVRADTRTVVDTIGRS